MLMILTILSLCAVCCGAQAQAKVYRGIQSKWCKNIRWSYDTGTRVLTVSGSGEILMNQTGWRPGWDKCKSTWKAKKIVFRGNITKIGGYTFESTFEGYHAVTSVELPESLKEIGDWAFRGMKSLKRIRLPSGLKKIGASAFGYSGLEKVTLPAGLARVGEDVFDDCRIREVTIPPGMKKIGKYAFLRMASLRRVTILEGVEETREGCFKWCHNLSKLRLPDSLKKIGVQSFNGAALRQIAIPKNVEEIENCAFWI